MSSFNHVALNGCVSEIEGYGAGAVHGLLKDEVRRALLDELERYQFIDQPAVYGTYGVRQAFSSVTGFSEGSLFLKVRGELEEWLRISFDVMFPRHLSERLAFTDMVVQRYRPGDIGISAHRDGKGFINLIAVLVLEGKGRFCVCVDRDGNEPWPVRNEPGDLVLMRGTGFLGSDYQPFHLVDRICNRRTTFALRQRKI